MGDRYFLSPNFFVSTAADWRDKSYLVLSGDGRIDSSEVLVDSPSTDGDQSLERGHSDGQLLRDIGQR